MHLRHKGLHQGIEEFTSYNFQINVFVQDCGIFSVLTVEIPQGVSNSGSIRGGQNIFHYCDVIMGAIAFQITSLTIVYSTVYSDADQNKHQSSASLAFVRGIHRGPVNSPHKRPVTRKMFPFDDVIMIYKIILSPLIVHETALGMQIIFSNFVMCNVWNSLFGMILTNILSIFFSGINPWNKENNYLFIGVEWMELLLFAQVSIERFSFRVFLQRRLLSQEMYLFSELFLPLDMLTHCFWYCCKAYGKPIPEQMLTHINGHFNGCTSWSMGLLSDT